VIDSRDPKAPIKNVLVFTATYNEVGNISALCKAVLDLPLNVDLLVVDDNSSDGTQGWLREFEETETRIKVIHRPHKMGLGSAHMLAMIYAVNGQYDTLVTMDADFAHDPADIARLVDALNDADFVIGSRYVVGGSSDYSGYRHAISVTANRLARLTLGIPLHEFTTSFRAFRTSMLREAGIQGIKSQGYSFFMETVWHISHSGYEMREVPIHFTDRVHGESKIPRYEILNGARTLLELVVRRMTRSPGVSKLSPVHGSCPNCQSDLRIEDFDASSESYPANSSQAYRRNQRRADNLQVVRCLACGLKAAKEDDYGAKASDGYKTDVDNNWIPTRRDGAPPAI